MRWTVTQLHQYRDSEFKFDETVNVSAELQERDEEIRAVSPIHVTGRADIDSQKVTFHLHITGNFVLPCARTLEDVDYPIDIYSTETFLFDPFEETGDNEETNYETHTVQGGVIDLMPVVHELLLLEVPIQVVSPAAKDDSLPAGNGWEVMTEEQLNKIRDQEKQKIDPRLAGLAQLLENEDNKEK